MTLISKKKNMTKKEEEGDKVCTSGGRGLAPRLSEVLR